MALLGGIEPAAAHPRHDDDRVDMRRVDFPVRLSDGHVYRIAGFLYGEGHGRHRTLQVLVHGATYDHKYWDIGDVGGVSYSYARYMARRGYAVLAIDLLGAGASSRPDGDFLNLVEESSGLHQVLVQLRRPHNPTGHAHRRIALVGHSNGSLTAIHSSGTYHDADALVTTAWEHAPHPLPFDPSAIFAALTTPYVPANAFPKAFRATLFYHAPSTDPAMFDLDYDVLAADQSRGVFLDAFNVSANPSLSNSVNVTGPVLAQAGDFDALQPSAYAAAEPSYYPHASSVAIQYLTQVGHNVNAHTTHMQSWTGIDSWLRSDAASGQGHGHDCDDDDDDDDGHGNGHGNGHDDDDDHGGHGNGHGNGGNGHGNGGHGNGGHGNGGHGNGH